MNFLLTLGLRLQSRIVMCFAKIIYVFGRSHLRPFWRSFLSSWDLVMASLCTLCHQQKQLVKSLQSLWFCRTQVIFRYLSYWRPFRGTKMLRRGSLAWGASSWGSASPEITVEYTGLNAGLGVGNCTDLGKWALKLAIVESFIAPPAMSVPAPRAVTDKLGCIFLRLLVKGCRHYLFGETTNLGTISNMLASSFCGGFWIVWDRLYYSQ